MLLNDMVTRKPCAEKPVSNLPLHIRPTFCLVAYPVHHSPFNPESSLIPVTLTRNDITDITVVNALHDFEIMLLMTALGPCDNTQIFFPGQFRAGYHRPDTDRVHSHGFLHKNMFTCFHSCFEVLRPEMRRRCHNDHVNIRSKHIFIRIKTRKHGISGNNQIAFRQLLNQAFVRPLQPVLKQISHGCDHYI